MNPIPSRRHFLKTAAGLFVFPSASLSKPYSRARPTTDSVLALGDLSTDGVVLWSRTNQPATFITEWSTYEDFRYFVRTPSVDAYETQDYTVKLGLKSLPNDTEIFVRSYFLSAVNGKTSERLSARFKTPCESGSRALRFAWSGDLGGQGYGINPEIGGYRIFKEIEKDEPNLFFNCGDVIYADGPLKLERPLPGKVCGHLRTRRV